MINAGVKILPYDGNQSFNTTTLNWEGVAIKVNYPVGQSVSTNPLAIGDYIVEPNGNIWSVEAVSIISTTDRTYRVAVRGAEIQSADLSPDFGNVSRGGLVTPVNGLLYPHWNAVLIATEVGRIATLYNTKRGLGGDSASTISKGLLPLTVVPDVPTNKVTGLDAALATKADNTDVSNLTDQLNAVNALLASDDTTLDQLQEIVTFIKLNRADLDALGIANIAGLQAALDAKLDGTAPAVSAFKLTNPITLGLGGDVTGSVITDLGTDPTINVTVLDNSHNHIIDNVAGLAAELASKVNNSEKGAPDGIATLDSTGKIPSVQLPGYVDDIIEVAVLPATGEAGKLYVLTTDNSVYRWAGTVWVEINVGVGTADSAFKLSTPRTISFTGDVAGSTSFDGSSDVVVDLQVTPEVSKMLIGVNNFTAGDFTVPAGVTVAKEYSDSSLRITHNKGSIPYSWQVVNKESTPATAIYPTSTRNMQVVDDNTIIITNISSIEIMDIMLVF